MATNQVSDHYKVRKSLSLATDTVRRGKELARAESRTFSNLIDALIAREYQRQFPTESAKEQLDLIKKQKEPAQP